MGTRPVTSATASTRLVNKSIECQSVLALAPSIPGSSPWRTHAPPHTTTAQAPAAPRRASIELSMRSIAASLPRLMPSASRTAISRRRRSVRSRRRHVTFAQATRSSIVATPVTQIATVASGILRPSCPSAPVIPASVTLERSSPRRPGGRRASSRSIRRLLTRVSSDDTGRVDSGDATRTTSFRMLELANVCHDAGRPAPSSLAKRGSQRSVSLSSTPRNSRGVTPMTWYGSPFT